MSAVDPPSRWHALYETVAGASHVRSGLPNQDSVQVHLHADCSLPAVLAVSDGHGSGKCFRSHVGSRLAVEIAVEELREFAQSLPKLSPPEVRQAAEARLPGIIVNRWRQEVAKYHAEHPFTAAELDRLDEAAKKSLARAEATGVPFLAYGATLLATLVTREYFLCWQLGDGEILVISQKPGEPAGEVEQPLPEDGELIANETTSLCQPLEVAVSKFRFRFQYLVESSPALVLLTTDGYPNSFQTPAGFRQVAADFLGLLDRDGVPAVQESLAPWLAETSQQGSGDDVTLAILYRQAERK
jgi:hypothetical protein